uniref:Sushi domain-containing protein n=1 Tax=Ciona savignyi TaxID=51511 RepID=H2ZL48_CIOSA
MSQLGNVYGGEVTFNCDVGFFVIGSSVTRCADLNNDGIGNWINQPPECDRIICPVLTPPENGIFVSTNSLEFGATLTIACFDGFHLVGNPILLCTDTNTDGVGDWNGTMPVCSQISCEEPITSPLNGGITSSPPPVWGSVTSFYCEVGFFMRGQGFVTCVDSNNDGRGEWDGSPPVCQQITCPDLSPPHNGSIPTNHG